MQIVPAERSDYLSMMGFDSAPTDIKPSAAHGTNDNELDEDDSGNDQSSGDAELQSLGNKLDGLQDPNGYDSDDEDV